MNYPANTRHWGVGDLVIHDKDAKHREMLMKVVGYTPTGLCKTQYIEPKHLPGMDGTYTNDIKYLHDPKQFELTLI